MIGVVFPSMSAEDALLASLIGRRSVENETVTLSILERVGDALECASLIA